MQNKKEINAGILIIGNEVLSGRTQDVNTNTLAIRLNSSLMVGFSPMINLKAHY